MINIKIKKALIATVVAAVSIGYPKVTVKAEEIEMREMYRLYNPNSGEHFYTAKAKERDDLVKLGWEDEGIGWFAPEKSESPVYRLYNKYGGEHHYTLKEAEKDALVKAGWTDEGIGWYSDDEKVVPVFREYNPNARSCNHNYTTNYKEHEALDKAGWDGEGIGWYGTAEYTDLHYYDRENVRVYSAFDDKDIGAENGMYPDGFLCAVSDETTIDFYDLDEYNFKAMGIHKEDSLKKVADAFVQQDEKNVDFYKIENCCMEEFGDSFVRLTRTYSYVPNEYYDGGSWFEITGLFRKNDNIYLLMYSCEAKNRSKYESIINYCLGKSLNKN